MTATPTTPAVSDEGLITRLTNLYAALAMQTKSYDAEAVVEAIAALKARPPVKEDSVELVERLADAISQAFADWFSNVARVSGDELDLRPVIASALESSGHTALSERVVVLEGERDGYMAALRWVYENGLPHDSKRPDFVNQAFSDAYAPNRAALNGEQTA